MNPNNFRMGKNPAWAAEGKLLKELMRAQGVTVKRLIAALPSKLEVSEDVVSNWCRGVTPIPLEARKPLGKVFDVEPDHFRIAIEPPILNLRKPAARDNLGREIRTDETGRSWVPVYGAVSAGALEYTASDIVDYVDIPERGGIFKLWGRVIRGDSMYRRFVPPAGIPPEEWQDHFADWDDGFRDGDIVVFEDRQHEDGQPVHAFAEGEDTFKIYKVVKGVERLLPLNSDYEPLEAKEYSVAGVAVLRIRKRSDGKREIMEIPASASYSRLLP